MIETSGWLQNVPYRTARLYATIRFDVRRHVFASRDFKENEKNEKNVFLQIVKVKGQTQGQGQIKVKGQGHLKIFTILYVIVAITWIYEKWKSASNIVNFQPILLKIDTHIAWTYPMYLSKNCIDPKNVTYVSMATNIPIIKHREFLHISMCYISAINEHIASKFTPVMQGSTRWMLKNQMTFKCQGQGQTHQ